MWGAIAGAVIGGVMANSAAKKAAGAMNNQAAAQIEAARIAAEEARFRPVGITTRFGSATPEFTNDRLTGYGYQGSSELTGLQDQLSRIYGSSLNQAEQAGAYQPQFQQAAEGLFNLGQQEMPQSREQIMAQQQALLRPYDMEQEQRLGASVFAKGAGGLSVGQGGNPYLQTLMESRNRRDQQLLANVDQTYMNRAGQAAGLFGQGAGLLGTGYGMQQASLEPFQSQFQTTQNLENVARQPMDIGSALGQQITTANTNAGNMMLQGQNAASNLQAQAAQARAASAAGMGQGIAQAGQNYDQREFLRDIYGQPGSQPPPPQSPAPITSMPVNYNQGSTNATSWKNYP